MSLAYGIERGAGKVERWERGARIYAGICTHTSNTMCIRLLAFPFLHRTTIELIRSFVLPLDTPHTSSKPRNKPWLGILELSLFKKGCGIGGWGEGIMIALSSLLLLTCEHIIYFTLALPFIVSPSSVSPLYRTARRHFHR